MNELINQILENPSATALVLLNLVIIESLLSVDNAAVLATMVMDLPHEQRNKALKYGIFGAFFFRGLAMLLSSYLIKIWWLQPLGGLYLLYLAMVSKARSMASLTAVPPPNPSMPFFLKSMR